MFISTELGHSINSDYIINISWVETNVGDGRPFLVKATGNKREVYYLKRFRDYEKAREYIDEVTRAINHR